jgi:CDP-4-dehydro-6-deoxyglucose reductase, E1
MDSGRSSTPTVECATDQDELRRRILDLTSDYCRVAFAPKAFVAGESTVPVSGRVLDADDIRHLVSASLDGWLTTGPFAATFEREFARYLGIRYALLCNSGSSANLLAISALTSESLRDERLAPGDEVITLAAGFPTTVSPIVQNGLIPVFVDIELGTYAPTVAAVQEAIGPRTAAVMLPHTLGNPFDLDGIVELCRRHDLWLIEDNCDAVGSTYRDRLTGTFGDLATVSFYPAHHMTMGEGGCVLTWSPVLKRLVESFRDWGRDCWCNPGRDNTCGKRFDWQLGELPCGYDHKYTYSHLGYNLKATDMQAAVGVAQLAKLPSFVQARKRNWRLLREGLHSLEEWLILPEPTPGSDPSWFGFLLTVRPGAPFTRADLVQWLEGRRIQTRQLFGANLVRQPAFRTVPYRVAGNLHNSDVTMTRSVWVGVYPALSEEMLAYVIDSIHDFVVTRVRRGL